MSLPTANLSAETPELIQNTSHSECVRNLEYDTIVKEKNASYQDSSKGANEAVEADIQNETEPDMQSPLTGQESIERGAGVDENRSDMDNAGTQPQKSVTSKLQFDDPDTILTECSNRQSKTSRSGDSTPDELLSGSDIPENVTELIIIPGGIHLYFVSTDNQVARTLDPESNHTNLKVLIDNSTSCVFIQVNEWNYPIIIKSTHVYKANCGAYLFPNDTQGKGPDGALGIVISTEVDPELIEAFDKLLRHITVFQEQQKEDDIDSFEDDQISFHLGNDIKVPTCHRLAGNIETTAARIGQGIQKATNYLIPAVESASDRLKDSLVANDKPIPVSPLVQASFHYAHEAATATANVSKFLTYGLRSIISEVGDRIAPQVKEYGDKVLQVSGHESETVVDGVMIVAGAGLSGLATVWTELERSGAAIVDAVSKATVENVQYKCGHEAAMATSNILGTFTSVGKTVFYLDNLGIRSMAKNTATDTGKAILRQYSGKETKSIHSLQTEV